MGLGVNGRRVLPCIGNGRHIFGEFLERVGFDPFDQFLILDWFGSITLLFELLIFGQRGVDEPLDEGQVNRTTVGHTPLQKRDARV
jgi:hypothetical protein